MLWWGLERRPTTALGQDEGEGTCKVGEDMKLAVVKCARWGGDCGGEEEWEVGWRWGDGRRIVGGGLGVGGRGLEVGWWGLVGRVGGGVVGMGGEGWR